MTLVHLQSWVGREETAGDYVSIRDAQRLAALLGRPVPHSAGEELPACWHWTLFQPLVPNSQLRSDGHPEAEDFLPPVPLPRRMFIGIEVESERPLRLGEAVERRSVIDSIVPKEGRDGRLVFVTLRHTLESAGGGRIVEKHSFVFREAAAGRDAKPRAQARQAGAPEEERSEPRPPVWRRSVMADPILVFRFVAAAFNAHRIHYDLGYATEVEGYAERLVPGRLAALLLLEELHSRSPLRVAKFSFRAREPLWVGQNMVLAGLSEDGGRSEMQVASGSGAVAMEASAEFRSTGA